MQKLSRSEQALIERTEQRLTGQAVLRQAREERKLVSLCAFWTVDKWNDIDALKKWIYPEPGNPSNIRIAADLKREIDCLQYKAIENDNFRHSQKFNAVHFGAIHAAKVETRQVNAERLNAQLEQIPTATAEAVSRRLNCEIETARLLVWALRKNGKKTLPPVKGEKQTLRFASDLARLCSESVNYDFVGGSRFIDDRDDWTINSDQAWNCPLDAMQTAAVDDAGFGFNEDSARATRLNRATIAEEGYFSSSKIMVPHEPAPKYQPPVYLRIEYLRRALKCRLQTAADVVDGIKALELDYQSALKMIAPYRGEGEQKAAALASYLLATAQELDAVTVTDSCAKQAQKADIYDAQKSSLNRPAMDDEEAHFSPDDDADEAPEPTPRTIEYHPLFNSQDLGMQEEQIDALKDQSQVSALRKFRKLLYSGDLRKIISDSTSTSQAYHFSADKIKAIFRKTAKTAAPDLLFWLARVRDSDPKKFRVIRAFVATITAGKPFDWKGKKISLKLTANESALLWEAYNLRVKREAKRAAK
jgi:hypothetical protein